LALDGKRVDCQPLGRISFPTIQAGHTTRNAEARICGTTCKREEQLAHSE